MATPTELTRILEAAKRAKPTKAHRPAVWEAMLGTLYACNPQGEVKYCDYRWEEALAWAQVAGTVDHRWARSPRHYPDPNSTYLGLRKGRKALFVRDPEEG